MKDQYILGLNGCHLRSHDAAACLMKNNEIVAIVEEERFIRQKRALDKQPTSAAMYCLEKEKIDVNDLSAIAVGFKLSKRRMSDISDVLSKGYLKFEKQIPLTDIKHHFAHAASVFYTSPFQEAAVLVVDGQGEDESTSIYQASVKDGIKLVESYGISESLGFMYSSISEFCGLGGFGSGKLMGLSAYGVPKYQDLIANIFSIVQLDDENIPDNQLEFSNFVRSALIKKDFKPAEVKIGFDEFTGKIKKNPVLTKEHKDLAASVQLFIEEKMLEFAREAKDMCKSNNLCLSGGVALNCVANSRIENARIFKEMFIQPACEDSGTALGAALAMSRRKISGKLTPYCGVAYSNSEIEKILKKSHISYMKCSNIAKSAAELVSSGKIVGWFQGGMEYGPRALGNRSILADPRDEKMKLILNNAKGRETWRPFGPSVLEEQAHRLFEDYVPSPFMLKSFSITPAWQKKIAAAAHVDGSTRPQTVTSQENKRYHDLLLHFYKLTGVPAVINTSFNYADEPIVCTPFDAIRTFYGSGLDCLALGDCLIVKV